MAQGMLGRGMRKWEKGRKNRSTPAKGSLSFTATDIPDLGTGLYLGQFEGGLYDNGSNTVPLDHNESGLQLASQVQPINGKIVFLGIGMSNANQEFGAFVQQAASNPKVNHQTLVILNGAAGAKLRVFGPSPSAHPQAVPEARASRMSMTASKRSCWPRAI
jgi:hypothetical protein